MSTAYAAAARRRGTSPDEDPRLHGRPPGRRGPQPERRAADHAHRGRVPRRSSRPRPGGRWPRRSRRRSRPGRRRAGCAAATARRARRRSPVAPDRRSSRRRPARRWPARSGTSAASGRAVRVSRSSHRLPRTTPMPRSRAVPRPDDRPVAGRAERDGRRRRAARSSPARSSQLPPRKTPRSSSPSPSQSPTTATSPAAAVAEPADPGRRTGPVICSGDPPVAEPARLVAPVAVPVTDERLRTRPADAGERHGEARATAGRAPRARPTPRGTVVTSSPPLMPATCTPATRASDPRFGTEIELSWVKPSRCARVDQENAFAHDRLSRRVARRQVPARVVDRAEERRVDAPDVALVLGVPAHRRGVEGVDQRPAAGQWRRPAPTWRRPRCASAAPHTPSVPSVSFFQPV